jgi:lipid-binding SYLF domain-containing protein
LFLLLAASVAVNGEGPRKRLNEAADVLSEIMSTPDRGIPTDLLARSQCIVVVPGLKGAAFGISGKYGKGFFSCRKNDDWSAPASIRIEGGGIGFQIGVLDSDLVMLIMNERGAKRLLTDQFTVGGDAQAAAGPVGRSTTAQTDALMSAEILSWSRARGAFAGISLQGATLRQASSDNEELYGKPYRNKDIVFGEIQWPEQGTEFHSILKRFARRAGMLHPPNS